MVTHGDGVGDCLPYHHPVLPTDEDAINQQMHSKLIQIDIAAQ